MSTFWALPVTVVLLFCNAFFVGAEFALIAARRTQIEPKAMEGNWAAKITLRAMERVSIMMAGAQLGITVCSLLLGAVGEPAVAHLLEPVFDLLGVEGPAVHLVSFIVAMVIVVSLHMVLGEMVPKNLAIAGPERAALLFGPPLYAIVFVLRPLLWLMNALASLVLRIIKVTQADEVASTYTADQIQAYVHESGELGTLEEHEHDLMVGAVTIGTRTARDVLVPLSELIVLRRSDSPADAERACVETGFSRFPVSDEDGHLAGYVHLKDLLGALLRDGSNPFSDEQIRALVDIDADEPLDDVLSRMQQQGSHIAVVRDEGRVLGAAMLEDVVETMVGDVTEQGR
ncbi:hemolysin family protein [Enemella sp. A6]|uniref:hemolysin family protein n=1 Tax=Enemella sp. A6 TaxID=3440152 RepID=UPI003EB8C7AA